MCATPPPPVIIIYYPTYAHISNINHSKKVKGGCLDPEGFNSLQKGSYTITKSPEGLFPLWSYSICIQFIKTMFYTDWNDASLKVHEKILKQGLNCFNITTTI